MKNHKISVTPFGVKKNEKDRYPNTLISARWEEFGHDNEMLFPIPVNTQIASISILKKLKTYD